MSLLYFACALATAAAAFLLTKKYWVGAPPITAWAMALIALFFWPLLVLVALGYTVYHLNKGR